MDFRPSPSQQLLASTAREFLRRHCPPERVQEWTLDARGHDETLWRRMAELGWPGLLVAPEHGGSDGSLLDVVLLVEEMGYACLPGPFVTSADRKRHRLNPTSPPAALPVGGECSGRGSTAAAGAGCSTWCCSSRRWATPACPVPS